MGTTKHWGCVHSPNHQRSSSRPQSQENTSSEEHGGKKSPVQSWGSAMARRSWCTTPWNGTMLTAVSSELAHPGFPIVWIQLGGFDPDLLYARPLREWVPKSLGHGGVPSPNWWEICSCGVMHRWHNAESRIFRQHQICSGVPERGVHRSSCKILHCCHQVRVSITDAHDVRSELEIPLLPSRFLTAESWWLIQPGVQDVRRGLRTSCFRCRAQCLLQSLDLCGVSAQCANRFRPTC